MVRGHPDLYQTKGRTGEALLYEGASLAPEQEAILVAEPDARVCLTARQTRGFIVSISDVFCTPGTLAKYLVRTGFCYRKPKCIPANSDEAVRTAGISGGYAAATDESCRAGAASLFH